MAPLEAARDITDDAPLPEQVAITQDERYRLLAALDQLPEDQRHVVQLRMAGLTGLEVAALMGRSHPAVKMLQQRAFVRLRELLAATAGDEERIRYG
jgi:RNA polymerase sigma-70 factor (ECF subfamily)